MRALRVKEPTFSCPQSKATARWAIKVSSVSPDLAETTGAHPASCVQRMASIVALTVPI